MTYQEILANARTCSGPFCKACPVCNGAACKNTVPGPGAKGSGTGAMRNYQKWQELCVNMDTICENKGVDTTARLFGREFVLPVFAAPVGAMQLHYGDKYTESAYNHILVKAAADYGIMAFTGDGPDPDVMKNATDDMLAVGGTGCPTIKPWNKEAFFEKLDILNAEGIFAVAMDVDGAGLPYLKAMNPNAGSKSVEELAELIRYAKMPFMVKGIMTVAGALKAVEAGASAIVVSNHGGRVQGGVPATAEVLPAIADAVKGKTKIIVDGGIRSGVDVFRALALGADAVLIGRPVLTSIYGGGEEGFKVYMDKIIGELKSTMTMCGAATLKDIDRSKLWNIK